MKFETIFFDLDSTLYPNSNGMWDFIKSRIDIYMRDILHVLPDIIPHLRSKYYKEYGTTLMGLVENYQIDPQDYLDFVHDIHLEEYLIRDRKLDKLLSDLPSSLWVFTNSDFAHAERVLAFIGIKDRFEGIIDVWKMYPNCKPQREAFKIALSISGSESSKSCAFIDDALSNVIAGSEYGMFSILVSNDHHEVAWPNQIHSIYQLTNKYPQMIDKNQ